MDGDGNHSITSRELQGKIQKQLGKNDQAEERRPGELATGSALAERFLPEQHSKMVKVITQINQTNKKTKTKQQNKQTNKNNQKTKQRKLITPQKAQGQGWRDGSIGSRAFYTSSGICIDHGLM